MTDEEKRLLLDTAKLCVMLAGAECGREYLGACTITGRSHRELQLEAATDTIEAMESVSDGIESLAGVVFIEKSGGFRHLIETQLKKLALRVCEDQLELSEELLEKLREQLARTGTEDVAAMLRGEKPWPVTG